MTSFTKSLDMVHNGLPELKNSGKKVTSFFEFWPVHIIYIPIAIQWLWLSLRYRCLTLPLISNPSIYLSGMVGESKSAVLSLVRGESSKLVASYVTVLNDTYKSIDMRVCESLDEMKNLNIEYPLIAKPDLGCRGVGVKIIRDENDLKNYLEDFPDRANMLLQKKIPYEAEAGIFYIRHPNKKQGEIFSITHKICTLCNRWWYT